MKSLGIFGGAFRPFHTGHFAKLALALEENDEVILFYTINSREIITKDMSREIYDIITPALKKEFGDKLKIKISNPTPIVNTFEEIADLKNGISRFDKIAVYGGDDISQIYVTSILGLKTRKGEYKEEKYYGTTYKDNNLRFSIHTGDSKDIERLSIVLTKHGYCEEIKEKILIRGTEIRNFVQTRDSCSIIKYLPNILSVDEKNNIIDILFKPAVVKNKSNKNIGLLPFYVG